MTPHPITVSACTSPRGRQAFVRVTIHSAWPPSGSVPRKASTLVAVLPMSLSSFHGRVIAWSELTLGLLALLESSHAPGATSGRDGQKEGTHVIGAICRYCGPEAMRALVEVT